MPPKYRLMNCFMGVKWHLLIYLTAVVEGTAPEGRPAHAQRLSTRPSPIYYATSETVFRS
jgi:hypothetical protein